MTKITNFKIGEIPTNAEVDNMLHDMSADNRLDALCKHDDSKCPRCVERELRERERGENEYNYRALFLANIKLEARIAELERQLAEARKENEPHDWR